MARAVWQNGPPGPRDPTLYLDSRPIDFASPPVCPTPRIPDRHRIRHHEEEHATVAVKIRLKRLGKIRAPYYRIVVADSRTKRDGRVIEEIGKYHPTEDPSFIEVDSPRAQYWLGVGAQPTEQVAAILKLTGDLAAVKGEKAENRVEGRTERAAFTPDVKKAPVVRSKESLADAAAAVDADAAADAERADGIDAGPTVSQETPEQVENS